MTALITPHLSVAPSARAVADQENHRAYRAAVGLPDERLGAWVDALVADALEKSPRPAGYVPSTHLW